MKFHLSRCLTAGHVFAITALGTIRESSSGWVHTQSIAIADAAQQAAKEPAQEAASSHTSQENNQAT